MRLRIATFIMHGTVGFKAFNCCYACLALMKNDLKVLSFDVQSILKLEYMGTFRRYKTETAFFKEMKRVV